MELRLCTQTTAGVGDGQTGRGTLQAVTDVGDRTSVELILNADRTYSTGEVSLALRAVTYDHDLFQGFGVFYKLDIQGGAVLHFNLLCAVAQVTEHEHGVAVGCDSVTTVKIGNRTGGRTIHHDRHAYHRLAVDIRYQTAHFNCLQRRCRQQRHQKQE